MSKINHPSSHNQIKKDTTNDLEIDPEELSHRKDDTKYDNPPSEEIASQKYDLLGKSTKICLPPKPSTSPPTKPNIEEEVERGTNYEQTKETTLIELDEEEKSCCRDTTSLENSTKIRFAKEESNNDHNQTRKRLMKEHPFIKTIKEILDQTETKIAAPPIIFECSLRAASVNWENIRSAGGLDNLIRNSPFSPISYGSEFRESWRLAPLLHDHPLWPRFKNILDNGSVFPLMDPPPEDVRMQDFDRILEYGNHKSAKMNIDILNEHLSKEVQRGWLIPLRPGDARKLGNASIAPMGVVSQSTINELGEIVPSNRVTHDLSFPGPISGVSINSRTKMECLEPCYYGHMLGRLIHQIVAYRINFPTSPIVLQKVDFKSAYRRMHLNAQIATQCLSQANINGEDFVFLPLRLSFGGSACPAEWCIASEITTDLANRILNHSHWHPETLKARLSESVPRTKVLEQAIPYHSAKPMIVNPGLEKVGKSDVYVDDICLVGVLKDNESELRLKNSILLALEIVGRPINKSEPLIREELASKSKLLAESGLSEIKCILGWELNTRQLNIRLPDDKYVVWSRQIQEVLDNKGKTSKKTVEIVTGRLNHVASIIPISRHFLSRIHFNLSKMKDFKTYYLPKQVLKDLEYWLNILQKARKGISLNLLTHRAPNKLYWSDACEYGIGGFSSGGKAWRWRIPENLQHRAHINLLEFMAELACIWDDILEGNIQEEDCILAFGDSTTAMGWIHKSKYKSDTDSDESSEARLNVARKLANLVLDNDLRLYSQWFAGTKNELADFLSREGSTLDDDVLTETLFSQFAEQVPRNCRVSVLRPEITSFFSTTLQKLPKRQQQLHNIDDSIQPRGVSGYHSSGQLSSMTTNSWKDLNSTNETKFLHYLLNTSDPNLHTREEFQDWLKAQSEIPSAQWHRHSWRTTPMTQESLQTGKQQ
jgi:hypothetical protein